MTANPGVSFTRQKVTHVRCLLLLVLFTFSLVYNVVELIAPDSDLWITSLNAFTLSGFAMGVVAFTYRVELMVSVFHWERPRRTRPETVMPVLLIVPLFSSAASALHTLMRYETEVLLKASALAIIPFLVLMIHGCLHGIRDPYWPAAFRLMFGKSKGEKSE